MEKVIFGSKNGDYKNDEYVSIGIHDDKEHVYIDFYNKGNACVYHFIVKDFDEYDEFVYRFTSLIGECSCVNEAEDKFNGSDDFLYSYLEDYPDYETQPTRTNEEIYEYMDEAFDRVWLVRRQNHVWNLLIGEESINVDILDGMNKAIKKVCEQRNIDFKEPVSDWDYGYWSGILAALRWVMGDEKDFLDT